MLPSRAAEIDLVWSPVPPAEIVNESVLREGLAADAHDVEANYWMARWLLAGGHVRAGIGFLQRSLRVAPQHAPSYLRLGLAYRSIGERDAATYALESAARWAPESPSAHYHLGLDRHSVQRWSEAATCQQRALALDPRHPGAHSGLGLSLARIGEFERAMEHLDRAVELAPEWGGAYSNRAILQGRLDRWAQAEAGHLRAIELQPTAAAIRFNYMLALLQQGELARGMALYESHHAVYPPMLTERRWDGQPVRGTLLLYAMHGLGDMLQFIRYVPMVAGLADRVVLVLPARLMPLLASVPGADERIVFGDPLPVFDAQASLLELPAVLGHDWPDVPAMLPYLHANPARVSRWRRRLGPGFNVGIAWQGNRMQLDGYHRSCRLSDFAPLARIPGVTLYSLQKDADDASEAADLGIVDLGADLDADGAAFVDTAAVMQCLDLVVTIDTSLCHLAGGLGRPVWTLLPYWSDWRWMLDRSDSPWYPAVMRLFRQPRPGAWADVMQAVADALQELVCLQARTGRTAR